MILTRITVLALHVSSVGNTTLSMCLYGGDENCSIGDGGESVDGRNRPSVN
jgi:hypothetical protein